MNKKRGLRDFNLKNGMELIIRLDKDYCPEETHYTYRLTQDKRCDSCGHVVESVLGYGGAYEGYDIIKNGMLEDIKVIVGNKVSEEIKTLFLKGE